MVRKKVLVLYWDNGQLLEEYKNGKKIVMGFYYQRTVMGKGNKNGNLEGEWVHY